MARLQILQLPPRPGRPAPYALVVDQTDGDDIGDTNAFENDVRRVRDRLGADAVLFFGFTVDVVNTLTAAAESSTAPCRPPEITLDLDLVGPLDRAHTSGNG